MTACLATALLAALAATDAPTAPPLVLRVSTEGLSGPHAALAGKAVEDALGALVAWPLRPEEGGPCADDACLLRLADGAFAVEVSAALSERVLEVRAAFADAGTGQVVRKTVKGGSPAAPEKAVHLALEAALPGWARRGRASVAVRAPQDSVVKVDGRRVALVPLPEPLALPAGVHEVDVLLPTGEAVLHRRRLEDGDRLNLAATPAGMPKDASAAGGQWRRPVAFGLWSAGAVTVAGALVAGGLSRRAGAQLQPCGGEDRDCLRVDQAGVVAARAQGYATAGNALMVGGLLLGASGAGLFTFDLVSTPAARGAEE